MACDWELGFGTGEDYLGGCVGEELDGIGYTEEGGVLRIADRGIGKPGSYYRVIV